MDLEYTQEWIETHRDDIQQMSAAQMVWVIHHSLTASIPVLNPTDMKTMIPTIPDADIRYLDTRFEGLTMALKDYNDMYGANNVSSLAHRDEPPSAYTHAILLQMIRNLRTGLDHHLYSPKRVLTSIDPHDQNQTLLYDFVLSRYTLLKHIATLLAVWEEGHLDISPRTET